MGGYSSTTSSGDVESSSPPVGRLQLLNSLFQIVPKIGTGNEVELIAEVFNLLNTDNFLDPGATAALFNFDGTLQSGLGDPMRLQVGARYRFGQ